jgi:hypothetical protein
MIIANPNYKLVVKIQPVFKQYKVATNKCKRLKPITLPIRLPAYLDYCEIVW